MSPQTKWTPAQIRSARRVTLAPLLERMGYRLHPLENSNREVHGLSRAVIIKQHYWHSPDDGTGGNAIDLLTRVMGMGFNEAMEQLQEFSQPPTS